MAGPISSRVPNIPPPMPPIGSSSPSSSGPPSDSELVNAFSSAIYLWAQSNQKDSSFSQDYYALTNKLASALQGMLQNGGDIGNFWNYVNTVKNNMLAPPPGGVISPSDLFQIIQNQVNGEVSAFNQQINQIGIVLSEGYVSMQQLYGILNNVPESERNQPEYLAAYSLF